MEVYRKYVNMRNSLFALFCIIALFFAFDSLRYLIFSSNNREYYSHIILIPFVSSFLIYLNRKAIFIDPCYSVKTGGAVILIGVIIYLLGRQLEVQINDNDYASFITFSVVIFTNGAFILFYGSHAFKIAIFPLLFLTFVVPIPTLIMDHFIYFLQVGSTEFTNLLFMSTGIPFFREGFVFHLSGQSVEVAKQCSGIRSSLALFITSLLAGYLFLKTWWKRGILIVCALPITMFKNGIRITTLTLLGTYVDPSILHSSLHRDGGILLFIVALVLMAPILFFLRKSEQQEERLKKQSIKGMVKTLDSRSDPE